MRPALGGAARNATTAEDLPRATEGGVPRHRTALAGSGLVVTEGGGLVDARGRCAFFEGDPARPCTKCGDRWLGHGQRVLAIAPVG